MSSTRPRINPAPDIGIRRKPSEPPLGSLEAVEAGWKKSLGVSAVGGLAAGTAAAWIAGAFLGPVGIGLVAAGVGIGGAFATFMGVAPKLM